MKTPHRLAALVLALTLSVANAAPSAADLQAYTARAKLYISMGQTNDQTVVSLRNYFGRSWFYVLGSTNIVYGSPVEEPTLVLSTDLIQAYRERADLYISLGQTPGEVAKSLNSYFGKTNFYTETQGWSMTTNIIYQEGFGNTITFYATVGTMKNKE